MKATHHRTPYHFKTALAHKMKLQPTPAESLLWELIHDDETGYHFKQQRIVGPYILDFYCKSAHLAVEVDGSIHARRGSYDAGRDATLKRQHGIDVIRFSNDRVMASPLSVVGEIVEACSQRVGSWVLPPAPVSDSP